MELTKEEVDFFKNVFYETPEDDILKEHKLSIHIDIPSNLKNLVTNSKLTLLSEIQHYQLWFPVSLSLNEQGEFCPVLGIPEIIDTQGSQRSWRINTPENVSLFNLGKNQEIEILSLSSTGITFKINGSEESIKQLKQSSLEMRLPDNNIKLALDPVRTNDNIIAAKFKSCEQGKESLRKFLYNSHKILYSDLYKDITS
jgi:hypothetical protein